MVRILPNGEIDNNPAASIPQRRENRPQIPVNQSERVAAQPGGISSPGELFAYANERLLAFGLPRIPIGDLFVAEPIHLVLCLLALVLFGPMFLIAVMIIIYITQHGGIGGGNGAAPPVQQAPPRAPTTGSSQGNTSQKSKFFMGTGQRLGS